MDTSSSDATLSIVVPVFNESQQLAEVVHYLFGTSCPLKRQWIFVDDCSTDGSLDILRELQAKYDFQLIAQPKNAGKGSAIIRGLQEVTGSLVMIQDADFEYEATDVPALLQLLIDDRADVVYGSRFKQNGYQVHRTYHYFVNWLLTLLSNLYSGVYLTDMETCYKIFRTDLLKAMHLTSKRFGIEIELTAYVAKTAARICEVPIRYYPRTRLQGKKINWRDGFAALWHLIRFNFLVDFDEAYTNLPDRYRSARHRARVLEQSVAKS